MNRVQQWLDAAGLPWQTSRADLAAQFGVTRCGWSTYDTVLIDTNPDALPHLLQPFSFWDVPLFAPELPPLRLSAHLWESDKAERNLAIALKELTLHLGPAMPDNTSNTFGWRWSDGPASISIICWPSKLQREYFPNSSHEREPRLKTACSINIETGFRLICTPTELAWLENAMPAITLPVSPLASWLPRAPQPPRGLFSRLLGKPVQQRPRTIVEALATLGVTESELAYVRQPPPFIERLHGGVFLSPDQTMLAICVGQLKILPMANVQAVHLEVVAPARGSGVKIIELVCQRADRPESRCTITTSGHGDTLERTAEALANLLKRPLTIGHSLDD